MKEVELFRWYLPPPAWKGPKAKPYLSGDHRGAETAKQRGAIRSEPTSRMVIRQAETDEERDINGSFSHLGRGWRGGKSDG